jgi:glycosyltransferase involved in cell wall biosynthesis
LNKIRVLHCIRQGQVGGGESHVMDLVKNLDPSHVKSLVLAFTDGPMISLLKSRGVPCFVIPTLKPFDLSVRKAVTDLITSQKIDLIHVHGTRAFSNTYASARKLKKPIVYTVHGWTFNAFQGALKRFVSVQIEAWFTRMAKQNINVSKNNREIGLKYIPNLKSVVIQNGIDRKRFNPDLEYKDVRSELGIPADRILIGSIARITEQKDPLTLIRAFAKVVEQQPNKYFLLFVGDGNLKQQAIEQVSALKLNHSVKFEDFRQDIPDLLQSIDIFCLPSLWEGLSLGLLEAMSMKKAVVASDVDGTREVIDHGVNGYLFRPTDESKLSDLILKLGENRSNREAIGTRAADTVEANFTVEGMTRKTEEVYLSVFLREDTKA